MHVMHMKKILRVQQISECKLEHRTTRRNDYTTGESEFVQNFENEAFLSVKYSMRVVKICNARPLRESQENDFSENPSQVATAQKRF